MAVPRDLAQVMGLVQALAMGLGLATEAGPAPALVMALEMAMEKVLAEALQKGLKSYQGKNRFIHLRQGLPGFPALLLSDLS